MYNCATMLRDLVQRLVIWITYEYLMSEFYLEISDSLGLQQLIQMLIMHMALMQFGNCCPMVRFRYSSPTLIGRYILHQMKMLIAIMYTVQMMFTARSAVNMEIHLPRPNCGNDFPMKQNISLLHTTTFQRRPTSLPHTIVRIRD